MDLSSLNSVITIIGVIGTLIATLVGATWYLSATIQRNTDQLRQNNEKLDNLTANINAREDACRTYRREYDAALNKHEVLIGDHGMRIEVLEAA